MTTTPSAVYRAAYVNEERLSVFETKIDLTLADRQRIADLNSSEDPTSLVLVFEFSDCLNAAEIIALKALYPSWDVAVSCNIDAGRSSITLTAESLDQIQPEVEMPLESVVQDLIERFDQALLGGLPPAPPAPSPAPAPAPDYSDPDLLFVFRVTPGSLSFIDELADVLEVQMGTRPTIDTAMIYGAGPNYLIDHLTTLPATLPGTSTLLYENEASATYLGDASFSVEKQEMTIMGEPNAVSSIRFKIPSQVQGAGNDFLYPQKVVYKRVDGTTLADTSIVAPDFLQNFDIQSHAFLLPAQPLDSWITQASEFQTGVYEVWVYGEAVSVG